MIATAPQELKVYSAADLLAMDFPAPRWLVDSIIPEGVSLIAAPPKAGKSWLALDLALTISMGGVVLNRKVDQAGTLYLALEDTPRRLKSRIQKQSCLEPLPVDPNNCHILTEWAADGEGFVRLHNFAEANPETRVILIDTYGRFSAVRDNNDYSEATKILTGIKNFADDHKLSVVLVHHTRKNHEGEDFINASIGSVGIVGGVDNILVLNRKRNQPDGVLKITGRDVEEAELAVHFDNMTCRWSVTGKASEVQESAARQEILDLLKMASEPMRPKGISDALHKNPGTTRVLLMKMVESGVLSRSRNGEYTLSSINSVNNVYNINSVNTVNSGGLF
jgi:RecA-family ATPase